MNKREAILFLEKKRDKAIGDMSFFGEGSRKGLMNEIRVTTYNIAINTLQQIDEPQAEKVEVTEKQAELLRAFRDESLYELLANCLGEDEELMAKAHIYGYTVKPTQWVVKFGSNLAYYFNGWYTDASIRPNGNSNKGGSSVIVFTDHAKAEAVATLVEGSVEEV